MLVVGGLDGLAMGVRRGRRRRGRAREADAQAPVEVPVTRMTVIRPGPFAERSAAEAWLRETVADSDRRDELVGEAIAIVNRTLHAHRLATLDAHAGGATAAMALAVRVGFGTGDALADGRWDEAMEVPTADGRRTRTEALRPQERLAAALAGRGPADACETLVLRARADLDDGRVRECALQLRVGLEALLAEVDAGGGRTSIRGSESLAEEHLTSQIADLAALEERRSITGDAANDALAGDLSTARADEVTNTLQVCERVLRRRRILAG